LAHALGTSPEALLRDRSTAIDPAGFAPLLARRLAHEPLALILGKREFWSLEFAVSPATLIPRPESETLIESALSAFRDRAPPQRILDLGTGTGCLLLAALWEFRSAVGVGVDRSASAAALALRNAMALGLADRTLFVRGDWADALEARFDLILCNPPYIPTSELSGLMPEVAIYEPRTALDGGPDGCDSYRRLLPDLPRILDPDGIAVLEMGQHQAEMVAALARREGMVGDFRNDLSGIARVIVLRRAVP
jgi:release factor glutamine methyltransferase